MYQTHKGLYKTQRCESIMRIAEVLSDLTTLYLAVSEYPETASHPVLTYPQDPKAALALVTARESQDRTAEAEPIARYEDDDPDLQRAKSLIHLHASVKVAHQDGTDRELNEAREAVAKVLREL